MNAPKKENRIYHIIEHIVFLALLFALSISDILQRDFTITAQSPIVGYVLMACFVALVCADVIALVKRKRGK